MPVVTIPGHGDVEFPDSMKDEEVLAAVRKLAPPKAGVQPTKTESALRGAAQGTTLGFGDEAQGAIQALGIKALRQTGADRPFAQLYKENRDAMRRENAAAKAANPWSYGLGQVAGGAPLALATGGGGAAGAGRLVATGAAAGGLSGLGESTSETAGGQAWDAAKGAGLGAALGGAAVGLGKAIPAARDALRSGAIGTARRILVNKTGSLSAAKALPAEAVQEVLDSGVIRPLGTSAGAAQRLQDLRETVGNQYAQIVNDLENAGITGPNAQALAQKYMQEASMARAHTMNPAVPGVFETAAEQVGSKTGGNLFLSQGEQLKRSLQGMAKSAYQQLQPNEVGKAHEAAASMMRQAIEDEVTKQASGAGPVAQEAAAAFEPVKERLSHLIAAGKVADQGMSRAANRHAFSLRDALAASGGMAHGGPIGAVGGGIASHVLGSRGASTAASAMNAGANALDWLTNPALTPAQARMQALIEALRTRALPLAAEEAGGRTSR
jgi:hypothetical protein